MFCVFFFSNQECFWHNSLAVILFGGGDFKWQKGIS